MIAQVFIDKDEIGFCDFEIIDISMGVIAGTFTPHEAYEKYDTQIKELTVKNGNANTSNYNFRVLFTANQEIMHEGGISLSDFEEERYIDVAGINSLENFK